MLNIKRRGVLMIIMRYLTFGAIINLSIKNAINNFYSKLKMHALSGTLYEGMLRVVQFRTQFTGIILLTRVLNQSLTYSLHILVPYMLIRLHPLRNFLIFLVLILICLTTVKSVLSTLKMVYPH